jgi:hypothetical protein
MADTLQRLQVELGPSRIEVEPGATPAEATVTLQNLGNVVEQYTAEVVGLDPEWFTAPVASVALFPQDRDQLHLTFHPPRRAGVKAGTYPFKVVVRARSGAQEESVEGILDVRGFAVYRLDITPRRQTARTGRFRLQVANTGTADVTLAVEGRDQEEACRFKLGKDGTLRVAAAGSAELPLAIIPRSRPWVGADRTYDFTLSARPVDARGEPQATTGQFIYHPFLPSWQPVRRIGLILGLLLLLLVVFEVAVASGLAGGVSEEFPRRMDVAGAQIHGFFCRAPGIDRLCGPDAAAARPTPNRNCEFKFGFRDAALAQTDLIGPCTTDAAYDSFGNGLQYTDYGVLFWTKATNTVYFFRADSLYVFPPGGVPHVLDGPGGQ